MNRLARTDHPEVRWSADFLDALTRSSLLRYLAVAHFGRGRGRYVEGEAPAFWRDQVELQFDAQAGEFHALWNTSLEMASPDPLAPDLLAGLRQIAWVTLQHLYPDTVSLASGPPAATARGTLFATSAEARD